VVKDPLDVGLFIRALLLARRAQRVRSAPIAEVVAEIVRSGGAGGLWPQSRVELAARRAVAGWRRWFGGIDTCLTRSLVLGGMLAGRGEVMLNVGFRPGEEELTVDGHAWVTVDGRPVGGDGALAQERYTRILAVPFTRGPGEE
jgi:hypothetical protein